MLEVDKLWREYDWRVIRNRSMDVETVHKWEDWFIENYDKYPHARVFNAAVILMAILPFGLRY